MTDYTTINEGTEMMVNNIDEQNFFLQHLTKDMEVLEFGCGISTLTIAPLVKSLTSVEHNKLWADQTLKRLKPSGKEFPHVRIVHIPANREPSADYDDGTYEDFKDYVTSIHNTPAGNKYDVIFIDGRARVACAKECVPYLKPGGFIFIHDYRHPKEMYRRREYEVVEQFLDHVGQVFAMGKFTVKPATNEKKLDLETCWHKDYVVDEMNRFYDQHIKNFDLRMHFKAFTDLLDRCQKEGLHGNHKLLDLGCGTAMLSEYCKEYDYIGADLPHVISGCAMRNYPQHLYRSCNIWEDDLTWIKQYKVIVLNGVIDVMQYPMEVLRKILFAMKGFSYLIIHRQEITENGLTQVITNGSYGGYTYHSIINRQDFDALLKEHKCEIVHTTSPGFANWENGGHSFLIWSPHVK